MSDEAASDPAPSGPIAPSDQVGRLGVMYVRTVLAQAALQNEEMSPGEDYTAVDLNIEFIGAPVRVQIKCGAKKPKKDGAYAISVTKRSRDRWSESRIPVYLVYVSLETRSSRLWLDHTDEALTTVHAHAHWARVNGLSGLTVKVPVVNRLTVATFLDWNRDVEECFVTKAANA